MTLEQLRVLKIIMKDKMAPVNSKITDRELLRNVSFNEGIRRTLFELEHFLTNPDEGYIKRLLELEGNDG